MHKLAFVFVALVGCGNGASTPPPNTAATPAGTTTTTSTAAVTPIPAPTTATQATAKPIDPNAVATATGGKPQSSGEDVKVSFPRTDVTIDVDGAKLPPFMGLTSWVAFAPGKNGAEAMMMGDLVLFEDEVNPTMSVLLDHDVKVTALHNHFFFAKPAVYFMHVEGEGTVDALGKTVKLALDGVAAIRKKAPKPLDRSGAAPLPSKSAIDGAKLDAIFGLKGTSKDGMYKATMGRTTTASCGCPIGKGLGVNTWAAFEGSDDNALVDGDFAMTESEVQPVLKSLRAAGIDVVAIHSHMTGENPRILFLHYWGRGKAADLAAAVKKAVDLTAWEGNGKSL